MMAIKQRRRHSALLFLCLLLTCLLSAVFLADDLSFAVKSGIELSVGTIIPSLFPFMILADLTISSMPKESGFAEKVFQKLLCLDGSLLGVFIIGNLSGAPVGASMISALRKKAEISRENAECALAISSGPSLAFTVSGVGSAMWDNTFVGIFLYISVILASVIYAIVSSRGKSQINHISHSAPKKFELIKSIESATFASLRVAGVITAFTVVTHLVRKLKMSEWASAVIIPLIELGGAVSYLSEGAFSMRAALIITAFALGFSGFSIHLQVRSAIVDTDMRYSRFLLAKLVIGILSASIFSVFFLFIK